MNKWKTFSDEELTDFILNSHSLKEVSEKMGYNGHNGRINKVIREIAQRLNLTVPYLEKRRNKIEDYIGKVNGYLEVIEAHDGYLYCHCNLCNKTELHKVTIGNWTKTKSCGCQKTTRFLPGHYEDLSEQIIGNFKAIDINKEYSEKYNKTYWNCLCLQCNKNIVPINAWEFKTERRSSCGCSQKKKSKGEEKINKILTSLNVSFIQEYTFKNLYTTKGHPYRFDFAIFKDKQLICLIEYHGKQHYEQTGFEDLSSIKERDIIKENYCKTNGIPLYIIPYTDFSILDTQYLLNKLNEVII